MRASGQINGNTTMFRAVNPVIPNGVYPGFWTGNTVEFTAFCTTYVVNRLSTSVRGIRCECTVTVNNENIEIST